MTHFRAITIALLGLVCGTTVAYAEYYPADVSWQRRDALGNVMSCGYTNWKVRGIGAVIQMSCVDAMSGSWGWASLGDLAYWNANEFPGRVYRAKRASLRRSLGARQSYRGFTICFRDTYEGGEVTAINRSGTGIRLYGGGLAGMGEYSC